MQKIWNVAAPLTPEQEAPLIGYSPTLRRILYHRGYSTHELACAFLEGRLPDGCHHSALHGLPEAVERIVFAINHNQPIAIYGDYDADGVTATALLTQALENLGADVIPYIPNRFDEGYGLNTEALTALAEKGIRLVITVDCGIRSPVEAAHARSIGLDLIITDHHHPDDEVLPAVSVINPKQPACSYPDKDLAGVGLAYKLACGVFEAIKGRQAPLQEFLDLVAIGTVADLAPLSGENRHLVRSGLESIRRPSRQGLMSLLGVASVSPSTVSAETIGFTLGPRLNAAGRLETATAALRLLLTRDVQEAGYLAQQLEKQNRERQDITRQIQIAAEEMAIQEGEAPLLLFAAHEKFNPGVVGLAASRLTEKYYRPSIVASISEETTRASCRSIPEFHITNALDECADLLVKHGGHAAAAGFTVRNADLPALRQRLNDIAQRQLGGLDLRPQLRADAEVAFSDLKMELHQELQFLQPTGMTNPHPVFVSRRVKVLRSGTVGKDSSHLKLALSQNNVTMDAIAFRLGHLQGQLPPVIDVLYSFEINEWNGRSSFQLNIKDIQPAG
jgi:single-stranded-DNA-specific exonuclease